MGWANRAHHAETPKQTSLCLRLRAPYFYPTPSRPGLTLPKVVLKQSAGLAILCLDRTGVWKLREQLIAVGFVRRHDKMASCNRLWIVAHSYSLLARRYLVAKLGRCAGFGRPHSCGRYPQSHLNLFGKTPTPPYRCHTIRRTLERGTDLASREVKPGDLVEIVAFQRLRNTAIPALARPIHFTIGQLLIDHFLYVTEQAPGTPDSMPLG